MSISRKFWKLTFIALTTHIISVLSCGITSKLQPDSERGIWPWTVAIFKSQANTKSFLCTGTLVSETAVITSAQCFQQRRDQSITTRDIELQIGRLDIADDNERDYFTRRAEKITVHPDWLSSSDVSHDADLAIVILKKPIAYSSHIQPICLVGELGLQNGTVVGWQEQSRSVTTPNKLVSFENPVISQETCSAAHRTLQVMSSDRTFCAAGNNGSGLCNAGAGYYVKNRSSWYLQGFVSAAVYNTKTRTCDFSKPFVNTNLSKFSQWISTVLSVSHSL
jgi:transmembrane protease serine 9